LLYGGPNCSPPTRPDCTASIARAAQGEFVRWDTPIYGRALGEETIIIDASLCPVEDEHGHVVFIAAEGRDITEKKAQEREIAQKNIELQGLLERIRELDDIKTQFFANVSHELRTPLAPILGPEEHVSMHDDEEFYKSSNVSYVAAPSVDVARGGRSPARSSSSCLISPSFSVWLSSLDTKPIFLGSTVLTR
jgi:signal transduction histidine kinase